MDIFERATRGKLRFTSSVGALSTEQMWDLPLTAKGERPNLDGIARAVHSELKSLAEASFVDVKPDPRKSELELAMEVVKHIITAKLADKAAAEKREATKQRKAKLMEALESKEVAEMGGMTKEQLQAEIAALGE